MVGLCRLESLIALDAHEGGFGHGIILKFSNKLVDNIE